MDKREAKKQLKKQMAKMVKIQSYRYGFIDRAEGLIRLDRETGQAWIFPKEGGSGWTEIK